MTSLYVALGVIGVVAILAWFAMRSAKSQGAAEQKASDASDAIRTQQRVDNLVRDAAEKPPDREANIRRAREGTL